MSDVNHYGVILSPVITEKSTTASEHNQVVFKVPLTATKPQIKAAIEALLKRNNEQAEAFGFRGTPVFIVGTFRVPGGLTAEQFKQAIADARKAAKQGGAKGK